jgi:hypothetical protein
MNPTPRLLVKLAAQAGPKALAATANLQPIFEVPALPTDSASHPRQRLGSSLKYPIPALSCGMRRIAVFPMC